MNAINVWKVLKVTDKYLLQVFLDIFWLTVGLNSKFTLRKKKVKILHGSFKLNQNPIILKMAKKFLIKRHETERGTSHVA